MEERSQSSEPMVDLQMVQDAMKRQKDQNRKLLGCAFTLFSIPLIGCFGLLGGFWSSDYEYDGPAYYLDTDALTVYSHYTPRSGWKPFDSHSVLKKSRDVEFKVEQLKNGNHAIRVRSGKIRSSHEGFDISSPTWSSKHNLLFFFEQSKPDSNGGNSTRIWQWKPNLGFQPVSKSYPRVDGLSLSLDQEQVTAIADPYNNDGQQGLVSYSINGRFEKLLPCPDDPNSVVVIGPDRYLFTRYDRNSHGTTVWLEQVGQKPTELDIGGRITSVVTCEGSIYGLRKHESKVEAVKLNKTLTGIEENFGAIH